MRPVPYSPFNRSYKYMCLQNQLAHNRNKSKVKGLTDTNISLDTNLEKIINQASTLKSSHYSRFSTNAGSARHAELK